jgi:autoinducer 2-degrading protein
MYVVAVTAFVKPEGVQAFIEATLDNARHTRQEPGNLRFDVLQSTEDPGHFLLYEAYRTEADFEAHHEAAHYLRWREATADLMAGPRSAVKCASLFFGDAEG